MASLDETTVMRWVLKAVDKSEKVDKNINEINVTEVASPCIRQSFYKRTKTIIPSPMDFIRLTGKSAHESLLSVVEEEGYSTEVLFSENISFKLFGENHNVKIVGRVDALKDDHIIEFKFPEDLPSSPSYWHIMQVQLYMWIFRIPKAYIVYISRKNGKIKMFRVYRNKRIATYALKRVIRYYSHLYKNIMPKPERGYWCNSCNFYMYCIGSEKNRDK